MDDLIRRLLCLPPRGTALAAEIDHLHFFVIGTTLVGALGVFAVGAFFVLRNRRRGDGPVRTPRVEAPRWLEAAQVCGLLALFLLWFQLGFRAYVRITTPPAGALDVYVVGKQWVWQFEPARGPAEVGRLHVPAGRPVRLLLTSRDVIHSFFVPAFRLKRDAVPGRFEETWFEAGAPGTYDILCAEYCGTSHSTMLGQVVVVSADDYASWVSGSVVTATGDPHPARTLAEVGREVAAAKDCLRCHTVDGSPGLGPTWRDLYGAAQPLAGGGVATVDEAFVAEKLVDPQAHPARGFQAVMPTYAGRLEPGEVAALIEYMKALSRGSERRSGGSGDPPPPSAGTGGHP